MSYEAFGDDDDGHMDCFTEKQVEEARVDAVDAERARLRMIARKAIEHRTKAETDGASRIMYDHCASRYLDELLAAIVDESGLLSVEEPEEIVSPKRQEKP